MEGFSFSLLYYIIYQMQGYKSVIAFLEACVGYLKFSSGKSAKAKFSNKQDS